MYLSYSNVLLYSVFLSATLRFKLHTLNPFISTLPIPIQFFPSYFFFRWDKLLKVFSTLCRNSTIKCQKYFFFWKCYVLLIFPTLFLNHINFVVKFPQELPNCSPSLWLSFFFFPVSLFFMALLYFIFSGLLPYSQLPIIYWLKPFTHYERSFDTALFFCVFVTPCWSRVRTIVLTVPLLPKNCSVWAPSSLSIVSFYFLRMSFHSLSCLSKSWLFFMF